MENVEKENMQEDLFAKVECMFYNYEKLKDEIEYIDEEIEFIKEDYRGCGSIEYSEKVQTSSNISSSVEMEILQKQKQIEFFQKQKRKKQRDLIKIERARKYFDDNEREMFKIRYLLKVKDWTIYGDKMNVCKDKYYSIRHDMIYKSINIMYPYHNFKGTAMESIADF